MRAALIALVLLATGVAGFYFYQRSASVSPVAIDAAAADEGVPVRPAESAAIALFNDICIEGRASFAQTEGRAIAAGWAQAPDDVHPNVARIMAISRGADMPQASNVVMHAYSHSGRTQFIVLTGMDLSGMPINGCYVYDFGATGLPELSPLEVSLGEPTERISQPGVADTKKWTRPASLPSVATLRMGYFPQGSPAEEQVGYNGLVLALTSMSR